MELVTNNNWIFAPIKTDRMQIELISKQYVKEIFTEKNNEEVNKYLANKSAESIEALENRINEIMRKNDNHEIIQLQSIDKLNKEFLWLCVIKNPNTLYPEIWLRFKKAAWWKWYGKELVIWLIDRIKKNLEYEYIVYETFADNTWSVSIIESIWWVKYWTAEKVNYFWEKMNHVQYRLYKT